MSAPSQPLSRINPPQASAGSFKKSSVSTALLGLTGALLSLSATSALAVNECGAVAATINCTTAGNNYTSGITYSGLTNNTINFNALTLNKVLPGPSTGVLISGTGNQTYNVLGTVSMVLDGRTGTPAVYGLDLTATGGTLAFNTSGGMLNLTTYGAGPDTAPGLTGIVLKGSIVNADLSNSTLRVEGGNPNVINISASAGTQSANLKSGNITMVGNSGNFPDYDAALEVDVSTNATIDTTAGTINVQGSVAGARGLIGSRTTTPSTTDGLTINAGNINVVTDNGMGVVAQRTNAGGAGNSIVVNTVAGTSITATGLSSFGIELNNANGEVRPGILGSVIASGNTSTAVLALSKATGPVTATVGAGATIQGGWMANPLATGSYANQTPYAAVGVLLGAAGGTATLTSAGIIGAGTDRAIESLESAVTPASVMTTQITNTGTITGTVTLGSGNDTLNNQGTFQLRGFADTNGDNTRDALRIAVSNLGAGTNSVTNSGTLSLPAATGATALSTSGMYLPLGLTANTVALAGPVQGQILGDTTFTNTGTIDMQANSAAGDVLVISGGTTAGGNGGGTFVTGGTLKLNTVANAGGTASQSDVLVVDSTQIGGGPTALNINMTGTGALTTGNGILVVQVLGTSVANAFSLASPITVGSYTYQLYQGGVGGANPNNWYLRSSPPQLTVTKTTPTTTLTPSGTVVYTVTVANTGIATAGNVVVSDPVPAGITAFNWTCAATGGATCPNASGSGAISETVTSLPVGASVVYTVTATISAAPPATVINTATANVPNGVCAPSNTPAPCNASASVPPAPVVEVSKTANVVQATPGGTIGYTLVVNNVSASAASNVVVNDPIAPGLSAYTWTCTAAGGAACPNASGSGAINETVVSLPGSASLTYQLTATVSTQPPASITNVATATVPSGLCIPGNTPSPCTTSATTPTLLNIPVPGPGGALLTLLAMVLAHFGAQRMRKSC